MAADSTCSLKFGPEWIRVLSDSSAGQTSQPQPTQATPPRKYPLAKHRYGKEELIAIYEQTLYGDNVPPLSTPGFIYCDGVYVEQSQTPRSLIPMTDEEQRLWAFQRVASSRGRGRGITPAPWAAARSVGGHLQQTRNWRSPEKPMSSGSTQSALSASSQFNYWRKNSLNDDEKVPEWADEKVPEDNDNVGSFDEKGGFLSLENRGRVVETTLSGPSSGRDSFLQRSVISGAESEPQPAPPSTLRSGNLESNVSKTQSDKPASPTVQPAIESGFSKRELSRNLNEKEPNEILAGNSVPCTGAAITSSPAASRAADDARLSLSQSKRAQVVILSAGPGTIDPMPPVVGGVERDITTSAPSERPLQQNSQWTSSANRDIAEALLWYYKDPQGIIQGPFSSADMLEWSSQGYFHDSLECRRACDPVFNPLGALKKVWNGALPFYVPNLHGPISTLLSASPSSAVFNVSNVSMGLGVNPLNASQALNGFVGAASATSVAVSSISPITSMASALVSDGAYFEESNPQFSSLTQHQSDFDGRIRQIPNGSDVGNDPISVGHSNASSRVHLEPELRDLESSIRRSVEDHPFNQTVNNHMTVSSSTTTNHQRGIISNRLIEHMNSSSSSSTVSATTTAPSLEQQADAWFNRSPSSNSSIGYHRGDMISQSVVNPVLDPVAAHHRTITQHELPDAWLVQRKNERNAGEILRSSAHHDEADHLALNGGSWNDFEYGDSRNTRDVPPAAADEDQPIIHQERQRSEQLLQHLLTPDREQSEGASQIREQLTPADEAPFEKVVEKKKKKDRKEKQREERLLREKQERESDDQRKQLAQQNSTDEEVDWDSGEQSAAGKMSSYHEVIIPAPAPAVPAWGNTQDKAMSALSLQEIQRLEEERASKERQQRQQEAVKNGYHSGIRTWANAIAPTKSFDQIQKEQQASKASGVQSKPQAKGTPASYPPLSAADVVANGIGGSPAPKSSSSKTVTKISSAQVVRSSVTISHNITNNNNNNGPTAINNHHPTINNNGGEKSSVASETTNNEQQLIDWCAQITKGLNSYLDMPTVVSILKDVESEAEIEEYVSQFFGESLKEPRQFARQFVQKRAKFNVGLASSLPKQSEWCTTGGNKKRKGTKK